MPNPLAPALVLLVLTWPPAWLLGRAVARSLTRHRGLGAVLPYGLGLSAWLLAVHLASLAAGSVRVGLPVGAVLIAAVGLAGEVVRRRRPEPPAEGRAPTSWMAIGMFASTTLIAATALRFHFHDELLLTGHMSVASSLQNGVYPPRHLSFPDLPLRYHYGFDLLVVCLTGVLRLSVDRAIDAAAIGLWALSWCLAWVLGERLLGGARAWLAPVVLLFGGGLPLTCAHAGPSLVDYLLEDCKLQARSLNPPVVSYFFQHPWSLGIPVALTAALLHAERRSPREGVRLAALAAVLALLSLSEVVLFVALLPALVVAEGVVDERWEWRRAARMGGVAVLALVAARGLGGFFVGAAGLAPLPFHLHGGFGDAARETLLWNLETFGLLLPLGVAGAFVLGRRGALAMLVAGGGLVVVNVVRYGLSSDIMKFGTLASLALGVLAAGALARLAPERASPLRTAAAAALTAGVCAWGILFPLCHALNLDEIPEGNREVPARLDPDDLAAVELLRRVAQPGEMVYRSFPATRGYAQSGGLPQPHVDWTTRAFGFPAARVDAREELLRAVPGEAARWRAQGFRWFVLDDGAPGDAALRGRAEAWVAAGEARVAATFGTLRVVELTVER